MEVSDLSMNTESLLEFNPKLADVSHHTRIAYAKFMTTKIKKEIRFEDNQVSIENEKLDRDREMKAFTKFRTQAGILKIRRQEPSTSGETGETSAPPASPVPDDFRARTPIEEDPNEDIQTPDRPSTPENILDEPIPKISSSTPLPTPSPVPKASPSPSPIPKASPSPSPIPKASPTRSPAPSPTPKVDSPMVKARSMSIISEKSVDSIPTIKTTELKSTDEGDESEEEEEEKPKNSSRKGSTHLNVPSPAPNRPSSPSISIGSGDKGKSKITGKTLTGWI